MADPTITITSPAPNTVVDLTSTLNVIADGTGFNAITFSRVGKFRQNSGDYTNSSHFGGEGAEAQPTPTAGVLAAGFTEDVTFDTSAGVYDFTPAETAGLTNGAVFYVGLNVLEGIGAPDFVTSFFDSIRLIGYNAEPSAVGVGTPNSGFNGISGTINWSASQGAQTYTIRMGTTSGGNDLVNDVAIPSGTSYNYSLGDGSKNDEIFVRVDAVNIIGTTTGTVWSFDTFADPVKPVIGSSTANGATDTDRKPVLDWTDGGSGATAATKYDVFMDTNNPPTTKVSDDQAGLSFTPPTNLDQGQQYFWFVRAGNDVGESSAEDVWSFTVAAGAVGAPATKSFSKKLVAASNDAFFYETDDSPLTLMTQLPGLTLDTTEEIQMTEAYQKIFIANGTIKKVVDFSNVKLLYDVTTVLGGTDPAPGMIITQLNSTASMVLDFWEQTNGKTDGALYGFQTTTADFTTNAADTLSSTGPAGLTTGNALASVTKPTVPHHYDWTVFGGSGESATYGALPPLCNIIALYYGRVVISGNPNDPHQWFMSRQFRPFDFLFVQLDAQSPVAGANTKAGKLGDIITALIAYQDDYLIFGCSQSIWFMRGDPAAGGTIDLLTQITGIFGKRSWTWGEDGVLYFFGNNGIYRVGRNFSTIENLTLDKIPTLVEDLALDPDVDTVAMGYDQRRQGLNISITVAETGVNSNFFYSLITEGFFPETYPDEDGIHSMWFYNADEPNSRKLLLGCQDGSIRIFDNDNKSDDNGTDAAASTVAISSEVLLGPKRLSQEDNRKSLLKRVRVTTGGGGAGGTQPDTDNLSYEAYGDDTGAGILEKYDAGTFVSSGAISVPGSSASLPLRLKAAFVGFKLFNDTLDETWAFENLVGDAEKRGRVR